MNRSNRYVAIIVTTLLLFLVLPAVVQAQYFYATNSDNTVTITGYTCLGGAVTILSTLGGLPVTSIGNSAFQGCSLVSVTIPDSVTNIGESAFEHCTGLANVMIGNGLISIGTEAFEQCTSLTNVTIPDSVTSIGESAFEHCTGLANVMIGNGVTDIGGAAFDNCWSLTTVTIPSSVTNIENMAFSDCFRLTSINVDATNAYYSGLDGVLFNQGQTTLIQYPCARVGVAYAIPDGVTSIGYVAFSSCTNLTSVTIPDSVTSIGESAFGDCTGLANVMIGNSVTNMGDGAFGGCSQLTTVTIPDSVTSIASYAFSGCSILTNVTMGSGVTSIGESAFGGCFSLTNITIPNSVTNIGPDAFDGCDSLTSVTIPDSVTSIGEGGFSYCTSLTNVTIPGSVTSIGFGAFSHCTHIANVLIGSGVTNIGDDAFSDCGNLQGVYFQGNAPSLGGSSVFITFTGYDPATVYYIEMTTGWGATYGGLPTAQWTGPSLVTVSVSANPPQGGTVYGGGTYGAGSSQQISASANSGWIFTGWSDGNTQNPRTIIVLSGGATYTANFSQSTGTYNYTTANGTITITKYTGAGDAATIPSTLNGLPVASIGDWAFAGASVTSVTISSSITSIGVDTFHLCTNLTSITIPNSVSSIGDYAFTGCTSLTNVTLPAGLTSIGNAMFSGCTSLTSLTIPASVTSIEDGAFWECTSLSGVYFEGNAPTVGATVFTGDPATVYYLSGSTGWGATFGDLPTVLSAVFGEPVGLKMKSNFAPGKLDTATFEAFVDMPAGFNVTNTPVSLEVAGVVFPFTLNAKGQALNALSAIKLSHTGKATSTVWRVSAHLKGDYSATWQSYGLTNATVKALPITVPVLLSFDTAAPESFYMEKPLLYNATVGKSGTGH